MGVLFYIHPRADSFLRTPPQLIEMINYHI